MSYSRKVYVKAASALERRRSKAERTQSMHREEAYAKIPELISIDREISSAGAEVIRAIGMGENAQRFIEELSKKNLAAQQRRKDILKENGYPENYLDADYTCKKCRDTGFVSGVMCDCYKELLRDTALAELNELSPSTRSTFESFNVNYYPDTSDPVTEPAEQNERNTRLLQGLRRRFRNGFAEPSALRRNRTRKDPSLARDSIRGYQKGLRSYIRLGAESYVAS